MKKTVYKGPEHRKFLRLDYITPLAYKVCKKETLSKLLKGYTSDVSQAGLLCNIKYKPKKGDILWLSFDRATLLICEDLEKRSFIYQSGIIGKVVRVGHKSDGSYDAGIQFLTREENNLTHIYPKADFLKNEAEESETEEDKEAEESEVATEPMQASEENAEEKEAKEEDEEA
jgi:hypothetical protein